MKRFPHLSTAALAAVLIVAAAVCVAAVDPFIDDQPVAPPLQPVPIRAAPTPPAPAPAPKPEPPKPLQTPPPPATAPAPPAPAPAPPKPTAPTPAPPKPAAPTPAPAAPDAPKPGEPALPRAKGAPAAPVPVATAPAKPVVSSSAVNITAVPTAAPAPVKRGEATASKPGAAALFDVKVKGTHVAISPSGDVMVRNPDLDINTLRVVQMIAGIVQAVKHVVEASKPARPSEPADVQARKAAESNGDDEEDDSSEEKEKGDAAAPNPPVPVIVKQKVTIVTGGGDADGVEADGRKQPLPMELTGDESVVSSRPFVRSGDLVDDAKPYARKLHYRVRRNYTPGASSVGDVRFDGAAPITMQLQQISTIPRSEFAPDSFRFAVDVPGQPTFYLDLPRNA